MAKVKVSEALLRSIELEQARQKREVSEYNYLFEIPPETQKTIEMDQWKFWALVVVVCQSLDIVLLEKLIEEGENAFPDLKISERSVSLLISLFKTCALNPDSPGEFEGNLLTRQIMESRMVGFLLSRCERIYFHSQRYNRKFGQPDVWHYLGYAALTGNVLIVLRSIIHMAGMGKYPHPSEIEEAWAVSCHFGFNDVVKLLAGLFPGKISEGCWTYSYCRSQETMNLVLQRFPDSYPWWSVKGLLKAGGVEGLKLFFAQHK
jgi:hypothetical protein